MKKLLFIITGIFIFCQSFGQNDNENTALILIDFQDFYFAKEKLPLVGNIEAAKTAGDLLNNLRKSDAVIIHVMHEGGGDIHELVQPLEDESIIVKRHVNAFRQTDLLSLLRENKIENLILAGMQTHMCLEAATRAADDYGFNCTVIHDACATRDLDFNGHIVKAEDVHASTLNTLRSYAKVFSLKEYLDKIQ